MRTWLLLLSGLLVWTFHFFALYIVGSVFLTTRTAYILTVTITLGCLAAVTLLFLRARRAGRATDMDRWVNLVALCGQALSGVAVAWQGLPALLV